CIGHVIFRGGANYFSAFPRLNVLAIFHFQILGEQNLCISSSTLVTLVIQALHKPENYSEIELSTPNLCTFVFVGTPFQIQCASHLRSIEHIKIYVHIFQNYAEAPSILLSWLLELSDVKWLEVDSITLQVLSLVPDLLKVKLNSCRNLKSLRVKMKNLTDRSSDSLMDAKLAQLPTMSQKEVAKLQEECKEGFSSIPDGIIDFLLQNSPSAKVNYWKGEQYFEFCILYFCFPCFFNYNLLTSLITCPLGGETIEFSSYIERTVIQIKL
ncbi:unnamed protein product, partial [Trifolium pratense]